MKKRLLSCFLAIALTASFIGCGQKEQLRFGTGNSTGNYYAYGTKIQQLAKDNAGLAITVKETAGSAANVRLMKDGFINLAIVQSDVLSDAAGGKGQFSEGAFTKYKTISELYTEQCQLVVPADSEIMSVSDLVGKKISLGEKDSGVYGISELVLQANGMKEDSLSAYYLSFSDSADALAAGTLDGFFLMAGVPTNTILNLQDKMELRLIPLDERTISYMLNLYDGYTESVIPAGTYHGVNEDIRTLGVNAVFIAGENVPDQTIEKLKEVIQ